MDKLTMSDLNQFTGTLNHYYDPLTGYRFTDGVKFVADKGGAYWLLTKIFTNMKYEPTLEKYREFAVWRLKVKEDDTATLMAEDGNGKVIYTEEITYTNFPLPEITLWFEDGVLILPSEH